jgi:hypothetical protein|tara:strand:- start:82 stop:285 length:204 start_codon:yes stop_codon:yes gene_type:complete
MPLTELLQKKYGPLMDLQELADLLRLKKTSVYQQIYLGQLDIPHIKRGKKYLFPTTETAEYLQGQMQ